MTRSTHISSPWSRDNLQDWTSQKSGHAVSHTETSLPPTKTPHTDFIDDVQQCTNGGFLGKPKASSLHSFVCGWGAGNVNIMLTFPINKVMFRQQLYGISARSAIMQLKKEGARHLYRGVVPPLLQKTSSVAIMFGMYDHFQHVFDDKAPGVPVTVKKTASAVGAGCFEALLTPFERVQVLLQDKYKHRLYRNTYHAFSELRPYGISEYYRGLVPIMLRNGPSNAVFFLLREKIKSVMPKAKSQPVQIGQDFVSGGIIGALISTLFYPINVIKTRMQARVGGEFVGVRETFREVFAERNTSWSRMFRGVHVNYTRSLISWGVINASYEVIHKLLFGS